MAGILARRRLRYRVGVVKVLIGLGGNLGDPPRTFATALRALARAHDLRAWSRLHRTRAVGPPQPDYWNLAAVLRCAGDPVELLALCHELERAAGRRREVEARWGPRTLDLDLLLVDGVVSDDPALTLPHPRFHQRLFALLPAAEIAPHWIHPLLDTTVAELARDRILFEPGHGNYAAEREALFKGLALDDWVREIRRRVSDSHGEQSVEDATR